MAKSSTVRDDLRAIRYYYQCTEQIERGKNVIGTSAIKEKVKRYNEYMCAADPRLYTLYIFLYVEGNSQESAVDEFGYGIDNIHRLHRMLVKYLQTKINEEGGAL